MTRHRLGTILIFAALALPGCGGGGGGSDEEPSHTAVARGSACLQALDILGAQGGATLDLAQQSGAKGLRATPNLSWAGVEWDPIDSPGQYYWNKQDEAQKAIQARGFENYRVLNSAHPDFNPNPALYAGLNYRIPQDREEQYKSWVRAVVRRYYRRAEDGNPDAMPGLIRPVSHWSYTPEIGTFWIPTLDPAQLAADYAWMFDLTQSAIKEVDPGAKLFLPFNGGTYNAAFARGFFSSYRSTITVNGAAYTPEQAAIAFSHSITLVEELVRLLDPDAYDFHLYGDAESIPMQKAWLDWRRTQVQRPPKSLYSMEGGEPYGKLGETFPNEASRLQFQSGAMLRHFALAYAAGFETVTFNLSSEYATSSDFGNLDLTNADGSPRPAYYTYSLAVSKLVPFVSAVEIVGTPTGVRLFRFDLPAGGATWIAWDAVGDWTTSKTFDLRDVLGIDSAKVTWPITAAGVTSPTIDTPLSSAIPLSALPVFIEKGP